MNVRKLKVLFLSMLITGMFCCSSAYAFDVFVYGSYWDKEDADGSVGGGLGIAIPLFTEYLLLEAKGNVFSDSDTGEIYESVTMIPFDVGLQLHFLPDGKADPYILGGVTYLYVDVSDDADLDNNVSGYVGAGIDIPLGGSVFEFFGEALYRFAELRCGWIHRKPRYQNPFVDFKFHP